MATPTLVQFVKFGGTSANTTLRKWPLPNAVLSGNAVIGAFQSSTGSATFVVSDDQGGTYTMVQNTVDGTNGAQHWFFYRLNVTNAPTTITITPDSSDGYISGWCSEWYNIASASAVDVNSGQTDATSTYTPGSVTTTATDDLILTYISESNVDMYGTNQVVASFTTPTNFLLLAADRWIGEAVAWRVQAAVAATNPAWATGTARTYIVSQVAFKNATQGTAPTATPRIIAEWHQGLDYAGIKASPFVLQIPFTGQGTGLYASYVGLLDPGAITDSNSNTWTASGVSIHNITAGNSGFVRGYYSLAPTITNSMTVSIAFTGTGGVPGDTVIFREFTGIGSFDQHNSGTLAGSGTSFQIGATTPAQADGLMFFTAGQDANTTLSVNIGMFTSSTDPNEETSPWINDENNAWSYYNNPAASAVQPTFTTDAAAGPVAWIVDTFNPVATASQIAQSVIVSQAVRRASFY